PDSQPVTIGLPDAGAPAKPTGVSTAPAGGGIGVDFTAPNQGDSAIVKYQYSTDDGNTWTDVTTTGDGPLHAAIDKESDTGWQLAAGATYHVRIRAVNGQGPGLASDAVEVIMPSAAPSEPWDVTIEPGDRAMTLTFGVAANGSPVTGWDYSTDDGGHWK